MSIIVIGINHKTAPIELREKVYFSEEKLALYLQDLLQQGLASEAVLVSTCNRSELYCVAEHVLPLVDWFHAQTAIEKEALLPVLYCLQEVEAIIHLTEVAVGLDSMVLGEPQIFGQVKAAFAESSSIGAIGPQFQKLFPHVFKISKEIRTMTAIGACPVSVASAAVHMVRAHIQSFQDARVLLVGAGETSELLLRYLKPLLKQPLQLVNRSFEKGSALANTYHAIAHDWQSLQSLLQSSDIVISATGSPKPIITQSMVQEAMQARANRALHLIDLAVPRDIESEVQQVSGVSLHCIDDLARVVAKHRQGREHAADKAYEMIRGESYAFMQELASNEHVSHTIRTYRSQIEAICNGELEKAYQQLLLGAEPRDVLHVFSRTLTNKLLHAPSVTLRQAGKEGRFELLHFAKQLFAVSE